MKSKHFMIDVETFGKGPYSSIIALGVVHFDPNNESSPVQAFYVAISPQLSQKAGFRIEADTVCWWMMPAQRAAYDAWLADLKFSPHEAMTGFNEWLQHLDIVDPPDQPIDPDRPYKHRVMWGNGPGFDNELLRQHFGVLNIELPWDYGGDRCFRTFKNLPRAWDARPSDGPRLAHRADHDALYQATWLQRILREYAITV